MKRRSLPVLMFGPLLFVPLLAGLAAGQARAQEAAALRARSLAASCAQCHGTDGRAVDGAVLTGLAGRPADELAQALKGYKSGARAGTVMPQLAKGYSDAQIEQLAAYFAALAP